MFRAACTPLAQVARPRALPRPLQATHFRSRATVAEVEDVAPSQDADQSPAQHSMFGTGPSPLADPFNTQVVGELGKQWFGAQLIPDKVIQRFAELGSEERAALFQITSVCGGNALPLLRCCNACVGEFR